MAEHPPGGEMPGRIHQLAGLGLDSGKGDPTIQSVLSLYYEYLYVRPLRPSGSAFYDLCVGKYL